MNDAIWTTVVLVLGAMPIALWCTRLSSRDQRATLMGLLLHLAAVAAQIVIVRYYYGYGDMLSYHRTGAQLADLMRLSFGRYGPEVWSLLLQQENHLAEVHGNGTATGSMRAISAYLCFLLGNSLWAVCAAASLAAFSGQLAIYFSLRRSFSEQLAKRIAWVSLYFPSVVFWTGGLLKETVAMAGFGWVFWAFVQGGLYRRRLLASLIAMFVGGALVGLTKAYFLFAFAVSASAAFYAAYGLRQGRRVRLLDRPGRLAAVAMLMVIIVGVLGALFPKYSVANVAEEANDMRQSGLLNPGGSTYTVEEPVRRGIAGQIAFAPLGFASAVARPLLFEVRNPMMLFTALEMTVLLVGLIRIFRRLGLRRVLDGVQGHPLLLFSALFVLVLGTAVGIATVNLGSLARYRIPILPFYGLLVAALLPFPQRRLRESTARRRP